jgi:glycosyltransferase involved in cell wall biosynthesis
MKICFVNPTKGQRPVYMVAQKLANRGHTCTVLKPLGGEQRYPLGKNVQVITIPCRYIPRINYTIPSFRFLYETMLRLVEEEGYDLIHAYDYQYLTSLVPIVLKKRMGIPITLTSNALLGFSYLYGQFPIDPLVRLYTCTMGRLVMRSYDRLVFIYHKLAEEVKNLLPHHPPISVINNGVDTDIFSASDGPNSKRRIELGIHEDERVLLVAGRLIPVKRIGVAIRLAEQLVSEGRKIRLLVVGDGPMLKNCQKIAAPLGEKVIFAGWIPSVNLKDYFAVANVHLLPSLSEGLPAIVMEAAACGVPSVVSNVGGTAEIVRHGETGFLCEPDDFDSFVRYTDYLLTNSEVAITMGKRARDYIRQNFDWERIADRYEQMFQELVG